MKRIITELSIGFLILLCFLMSGCAEKSEENVEKVVTEQNEAVVQEERELTEQNSPEQTDDQAPKETTDVSAIPPYSGQAYVELNNNVPNFTAEEMTTDSFESYSNLDSLGRVGVAYACLGEDLMPTEERGDISEIKPTGWHSSKYDFIDGDSLYNRCHLIGFQLSGENANEKNLMTGTRYMNTKGMLPFENAVAEYIKTNGGHVLYRVTPVFKGDNLVADGVQMEAYSVEDNGYTISYNVFCYNVEPGVNIDYATGDNSEAETGDNKESQKTDQAQTQSQAQASYVLNTKSKKFHKPDCESAANMSEKNKQEYTGSREELINQGYSPCKNCNP